MDPRYPIGRFDPSDATPLAALIDQLAALPVQARLIAGMIGDTRLDTPYREGGWTARQVIHHLADSQVNGYVRFRLALTEDRPAIKIYDENRWAELPDARHGGIESSLVLLEGLQARWVALLRTLSPEDCQRVFVHPERGEVTLEQAVRLYAWHGRHHLAHLALCEAAGR